MRFFARLLSGAIQPFKENMEAERQARDFAQLMWVLCAMESPDAFKVGEGPKDTFNEFSKSIQASKAPLEEARRAYGQLSAKAKEVVKNAWLWEAPGSHRVITPLIMCARTGSMDWCQWGMEVWPKALWSARIPAERSWLSLATADGSVQAMSALLEAACSKNPDLLRLVVENDGEFDEHEWRAAKFAAKTHQFPRMATVFEEMEMKIDLEKSQEKSAKSGVRAEAGEESPKHPGPHIAGRRV